MALPGLVKPFSPGVRYREKIIVAGGDFGTVHFKL